MNLIPNDGITILLKGGLTPMTGEGKEKLAEKQVTYTLNLNGRIIIIENVPARVNEETGEQFFSPAIVEHLQQTILDSEEPDHFVKVPVYHFTRN